MTDPVVQIQVDPTNAPSTPSWFGEVVAALKYRFFGAVKQQSALVLVADVSVPAYAGTGGVQRAVAVSWES